MMGLFDFFKMFKPSKIESKYNELMEKAYNALIQDDNISQLSDEEKVFYVVYYFNAEWQNGGLCQFFVNSSRVYAPIIGEYLGCFQLVNYIAVTIIVHKYLTVFWNIY